MPHAWSFVCPATFQMRIGIRIGCLLAIAVIALANPSSGSAQVGGFTSFDVPGASLTRPFDVNNSGAVVGFYTGQAGTHGFVLNQGKYTTVDFPGAVLTAVMGINDLGQLVGRFQTEEGVDHGFLLSNGVFRQIDFPGSISTQCHGINKKGQIVGRYFSVENPAQGGGQGLAHEHGFLLTGNSFTSIDFPDADTTDAWKITDDGDIVGDWTSNGALNSGSLHGYVMHDGRYSSFDFPGAAGTAGRDINAGGELVGGLYDKKCVFPLGHSFVLVNGSYESFDFPSSACTNAQGVNNAGVIVGAYADGSGAQHGYLASLNQK